MVELVAIMEAIILEATIAKPQKRLIKGFKASEAVTKAKTEVDYHQMIVSI